jgi:adrenodoxin-NADP+ reductase
VGRDVSLLSLTRHYDAILFAYGASKDRNLGIPNEDQLSGIYSARAFVGWYNGLPEYAHLFPDLTVGEDVVVIGQGNVALDVARILLTDVDILRRTDITENALAALSQSRVKRVRIIGRRGPMQVRNPMLCPVFGARLILSQAAFTIKEVRELMKLPLVNFAPIPLSLLPPEPSKLPRTQKRLVELMLRHSSIQPSQASKAWSLEFLLSPISFNSYIAKPTSLSSITFAKTKLQGEDQFRPSATVELTNDRLEIPASLAFRSIGYKSEAIPGMESLGIIFDDSRGIISNDYYGRVIRPSQFGTSKPIPGMYCAGWVKRGPTGVIANTMEDAFATAEAISKDWCNGASFLPGGQGWPAVKREMDDKGIRTVSWDDWRKIDAAERARGKERGKAREKFTTVEEMLNVLD